MKKEKFSTIAFSLEILKNAFITLLRGILYLFRFFCRLIGSILLGGMVTVMLSDRGSKKDQD